MRSQLVSTPWLVLLWAPPVNSYSYSKYTILWATPYELAFAYLTSLRLTLIYNLYVPSSDTWYFKDPSFISRHRNEFRLESKSFPYTFERRSNSAKRNQPGLGMSSNKRTASSTKNETSIIHSLEKALIANGIQVTDGAVQALLDKREWIYPSQRVKDLKKKMSEDQLYSVFNYNHHLNSSALLFEFLNKTGKESCVVYGHKAQGKTQFLYFVFKLLQAMGEKVLFLDRTLLPIEFDGTVNIKSKKFCGHLWRDTFLQMEGEVKTCLDQFYHDALPSSFGKFLKVLLELSQPSITVTRVWIIVDEVVLFDKFPIKFPEEQDLGPFKWIITGSAGIGSWVAKRHLEKFVFDLPLFEKDECLEFTISLSSILNINVEDVLRVPSAGIDDWLEERFGGVIGYAAEMFLEISKGDSVTQYMMELSRRMKTIISNVAERRGCTEDQLSSVWLKEIKSKENQWDCLRNAGLCGSSPPRGIIFTEILKWLCTFCPEEDALRLVTVFRIRFEGDPGLDSCLLE